MKTKSKLLAVILEASEGRFVTVDFIKKDGTLRTLNGRLGVHTKTANQKNYNQKYITIYDIRKGAYRSVNRDTIVALRTDGIEAFVKKD